MNPSIIQTDKAPKAIGPYSQGVCLNGVYYFSGQIGLIPSSGEMAQGFDAQLKQVLSNIDGLLTSQNLSRSHVVKTTIFIKNMSDFPGVNAAYEDFFKAPYPARSTVEVSGLPKGALVEIEVIAAK